MSEYQTIMDVIDITMADQPKEVQEDYCVECLIRDLESLPTERKLDVVVAGLDMLCALAKEGRVKHYGAGQLITRAQLIGGFILSQQPTGLRSVRLG
jgi:hypothetical protein